MARIVLVADDSPTIQKRAVGILKGDGYEVETVSNGVAAIKRLAVIRPSVILADVCMPGRDGYEVCEYVKKTPEFSHIPVVLLTSDMEPYDGAKGVAVKADGILKKPFEGRELITLVDRLAEQYENAAPPVGEVSIAPSTAAAPAVEEFEMAVEPEMTPTLVSAPEPDFSAHSSGVAFAEPGEEAAPAFPLEPHGGVENFPLGAHQSPSAPTPDFDFPTLHAEEPALPAPSNSAFDPPHAAEVTHSFLESMAAAPEHPLFTEEASAPAAQEVPAALRTAIFRAPVEIPEPVWKEAAAPAARAAESTGATALEPQFISEDFDVSALGDHGHAHPHDHEHDHEHSADHSHPIDPLNATNLGSFSLDAAAAGHVRFNSDVPEVIYADETAEASSLAEPAVESVPEASAIPEVVYAEASSEEAVLQAPAAEVTSAESASDEPVAQVKEPSATAPEVVYAETSSEEPAASAPVVEAPAPEADASEAVAEATKTPEVRAISELVGEPVNEESHEVPAALEPAEIAVLATPADELPTAPAESEHSESIPEHSAVEPFPLEAVKDTVHEIAAAVGTVSEPSAQTEIAVDPAVAEALKPGVAPTEPSLAAEGTSAPTASTPTPAPKPDLDPELVYSIVHKVVAHMAPSFLGDEAKADMAKRLADQIAAEFRSK